MDEKPGRMKSLGGEVEGAQEICTGAQVKDLDPSFSCCLKDPRRGEGEQQVQLSRCGKAQRRGCACGIFKEYSHTLKTGPELKPPQAEMLSQNQQDTIPQGYVIQSVAQWLSMDL